MNIATLQTARSQFSIGQVEQFSFGFGLSVLRDQPEPDQAQSADGQARSTNDIDRLASVEMPIRILLVDEQAMVREGLRLIIKNHPKFKLVGDAGNSEDALAIAVRQQPDIVVLDPASEGDITHTIIGDLLAASKEAHIIILTGARNPDIYRAAISLGAKGLVLKQEVSQILIKAIEKVYAGETWLERSATAGLLTEVLSELQNRKKDPETTKIAKLTMREREVIGLIAEGLKTRQIAEHLLISQATVSHHLTSIFNKLGISDRLQLMVYAFRQGLTRSDHWHTGSPRPEARTPKTSEDANVMREQAVKSKGDTTEPPY